MQGNWLSGEDKQFYQLQLSSNGSIGYATAKEISIHPSKRERCFQEATTSFADITSRNESSATSSEEDEWTPPQFPPQKRCRNSTRSAVSLVRKGKLSTKNASQVLHILKNDGHDVPAPSQSGVYKAVYKESRLLIQHMKETLKNYEWCLHFDGKNLDGEKQVVLIKNRDKEIRLAVLTLENGRATTIFNAIKEILMEYELWPKVKMIICDTTNTNSGSKNGIVTQLQKYCKQVHGYSPQYIGCQHHVLDRVLRHAMEFVIGGKTSNPNISYPFVSKIIENYESLKRKFGSQEDSPILTQSNIGWRDDMKFLFHLSNVFCYYDEHNVFPFINFQTLPGISNARWNSRAIFALLAFILLPETRSAKFTELCRFIARPWSTVWFLDQQDWKPGMDVLKPQLQNFSNANKCFDKHWKREDSVITGVERSNRCAERAIKILGDIFPFCKSDEKLNQRFILTNDISLS